MIEYDWLKESLLLAGLLNDWLTHALTRSA
jgi:hypothetical protein